MGNWLSKTAIAAFTGIEVANHVIHVGGRKIGPKLVGKIQFGIGGLPEQEIGDAKIAARTDDHIGIAAFGGIQGIGYILLGDGGLSVGNEAIEGVRQFGAASVVECYVNYEIGVGIQ